LFGAEDCVLWSYSFFDFSIFLLRTIRVDLDMVFLLVFQNPDRFLAETFVAGTTPDAA
jgi:hypothetical protein